MMRKYHINVEDVLDVFYEHHWINNINAGFKGQLELYYRKLCGNKATTGRRTRRAAMEESNDETIRQILKEVKEDEEERRKTQGEYENL